MRAKFPIVLAVLVLCGCHRKGSGDEALLFGTWSCTNMHGGGGTLVLATDGTFVWRYTNRWATGSKVFADAGTWRLDRGIVTSTCTNMIEPEGRPVGTVDRARISRLTAVELAWEGLDDFAGQTNVFTRVK